MARGGDALRRGQRRHAPPSTSSTISTPGAGQIRLRGRSILESWLDRKLCPPETRIDRHHQHQIELVERIPRRHGESASPELSTAPALGAQLTPDALQACAAGADFAFQMDADPVEAVAALQDILQIGDRPGQSALGCTSGGITARAAAGASTTRTGPSVMLGTVTGRDRRPMCGRVGAEAASTRAGLLSRLREVGRQDGGA